MGELLSLGSAAGLAALLAGAIGVWAWWRKARSRGMDPDDAHGGATTAGAIDGSVSSEGIGLAEAESAEGAAGSGEAKGGSGLKDATPDDGRVAWISPGEGKAPVHPIETAVQVPDRPPAEERRSGEHTREDSATDSADVPSKEMAEVARPAGDQSAGAAREEELEEELAAEEQGGGPKEPPSMGAPSKGEESHSLGESHGFPALIGRGQMDTSDGQPSEANESVLAEQDELAAPQEAGDGTAREMEFGEERPVDAGSPANADETRPSVNQTKRGRDRDTSVSEDPLRAGQITQGSRSAAANEEERPNADSVEPPVEEAPSAARLPSVQDSGGETPPEENTGKQFLSGAQHGETAVNPSTSSAAAIGRQPPQAPTFYNFLVDAPHAGPGGNSCRTSCPDCLRDFSNLPYHPILDWRLGLDVARLALDSTAPIDFSVSYWQGLDAAVAGPYFAAMPGWQQTTMAGLQAGSRGNVVEIITHPLWDCDPNRFGAPLAAAHAQAAAGGNQVQFKSLFEVLRRPF